MSVNPDPASEPLRFSTARGMDAALGAAALRWAADEALAYQAARWIILRRGATTGAIPSVPQANVTPLPARESFRAWTDTYSSPLQILK